MDHGPAIDMNNHLQKKYTTSNKVRYICIINSSFLVFNCSSLECYANPPPDFIGKYCQNTLRATLIIPSPTQTRKQSPTRRVNQLPQTAQRSTALYLTSFYIITTFYFSHSFSCAPLFIQSSSSNDYQEVREVVQTPEMRQLRSAPLPAGFKPNSIGSFLGCGNFPLASKCI